MLRRSVDVAVAGAVCLISCVAAVVGFPTPVLVVVGIALIAAPAYVWGEILLTPRTTGLERFAVEAGLALVTPVLGGLLLRLLHIPLDRSGWIGLLVSVTAAGCAVLMLGRRRGHFAPRGAPALRVHVARRHLVAFGIAAAMGIGALIVASRGAALQQRVPFTQLWLVPHGAGNLSVGVKNYQGATTRYRVVLLMKGRVHSAWQITLANGKEWQRSVKSPTNVPVVVDLYRPPDLQHPYRQVSSG